ncbi:MAG: hypothetical protein ACR2KK_07485 [Acidimicrobiales bacterium]
MTLALRRFRLEGIGPAGARFDPLQVDLLAGGAAARSAVLFLENGGGKSVLLRLLFAVVLPGRRQTLGGAKLDGYVLTGDTGHVVLEWDLPDGSHLVTGLVLEWRGRQRSSSAANLLPLWYAFRPLAGALTFDTLPTTEEARRRTRTGFRERLNDLGKAFPGLQLVVEDQSGRWRDHLLSATPLDPEAFRYQRTMNADEADAESLFAGIRDDDGFVRFVLEAVHDGEDLAGFDELVASYAGQLARRGELVAEAAFATAAASALSDLAATWSSRGAARTRAAAAEADAIQLRLALDAGAVSARSEEASTRAEAMATAERQRAVNAQADRASAIASELRRIEAVLLHRRALEAEHAARAAVEASKLQVAAWNALPACLDRTALTAEARRLREAQEAAERDLAPLRERAEADEARYAARLSANAATLDGEAVAARTSAGEHDQRASALDAQSRTALGEAARLEERRRALLAQVTRSEAAIDDARSAGLLRAAEPVAVGAARLDEEARRTRAALVASRARRGPAQAEQRTAATAVLSAEGTVDRSGRELGGVRAELDAYVTEATAIAADPRVQALAPGAVDVWAVADHLDDRLTVAVQAGRSSVRSLDEQLAALRNELDALGVDGLLPPTPDLRRVWDALASAGIAATSGWQWLADKLDTAGRVAALERNPGVAGGVLVADAGRIDDARRALIEAGVETTGVVVLGTAADLDLDAPGVPAPVRPAQYDPAWTQRERVWREAEAERIEAELSAARARLAVDEPLLDRVHDALRRCPPAKRSELAGRVERLEVEVSEASARLQSAQSELATADATVRALDEAEPRLSAQAEQAASAARSASDLADAASEAAIAATDAASAGEMASRARQEAERTAATGADARRAAEQSRAAATRAFDAAAALRSTVAALGASPVPDPPATETTEALRASAGASRRAYESEREGRDLTPTLHDVETRLARRHREMVAVDPEVVAEAERLALLPAASDEGSRLQLTAEARRRLVDSEADRDRAVGATGAAEEVVRSRTPLSERQRHFALDPDDEPTQPQEAATRAAAHTAEAVLLTQEARTLGATVQTFESRAGAAAVRGQLLDAAAALLPVPPDVGGGSTEVEPWTAGAEEAQSGAQTVRRALDEERTGLDAAEQAFERAERAVRGVAADPTYRSVGGLRVALAEEPVESLAPRSGAVAAELEAMRSSVESELADIARHREGIVLRLATLVDHHLGLLGRLAKLSTLPDDLGGWSRRPFIRIGFDRHDAAQLHARLEPIVDGAASADRRRSGPLDIVLAGMRAAVQSGPERPPFQVSMLRPNRTMKEERATVAELEAEFSGGMKLTAAICTYCALAALRAGSRSTGGLFGGQPGPLFLDNPLGKASADYLLDLQHRLAAKLGVQLVHTTGVWDVEALGTYERTVRLRNLSDLRANLQRIKVDDKVDLGIRAQGTGVDAVGFTRRRA